jgi:hypothetical protein
MKKFFVLGLALAASLAATAQDDSDIVSEDANDVATNKKGQVITPQAGDIGLVLDGQPLLQYALDLTALNNGGAGATGFLTSPDGTTLQARYFLDDATAIRAIFEINTQGQTTKAFTADLSSTDPLATVEDVTKVKGTFIGLGGIYEMRRGYGKLQGYYGPYAFLSFVGASTENTFGNSRENLGVGTHTLSTSTGTSIGVQLGGVLGAEYFFARKMSIGGEVSWGLALNTISKGETTTETYDGTSTTTSTVESYGAATTSGFGSNAQADVLFSLYF